MKEVKKLRRCLGPCGKMFKCFKHRRICDKCKFGMAKKGYCKGPPPPMLKIGRVFKSINGLDMEHDDSEPGHLD